jgi:CRISPR system Cascade subunit CasB
MKIQMPEDYGERAREWWRELLRDNAARARLRRCHRPIEALLEPDTLSLLRRLGWRGDRGERVAALAVVLAHVRQDRREQFGSPDSLLSEARFRRLLIVRRAEELMEAMTRLVRVMDGMVNVADLANSMLWWTDRTRADWAYAYYGASTAMADNNKEASNG